ncbi:DUF3302 domain-containing protein [Kaarinaea lacus]
MTGFDIAAWFVLLLLAALGIAAVVLIGSLPGVVASKRNHPYADAIMVGGWATLLVGVVLWPVVLMWAFCPDLAPNSKRNQMSTDATAGGEA